MVQCRQALATGATSSLLRLCTHRSEIVLFAQPLITGDRTVASSIGDTLQKAGFTGVPYVASDLSDSLSHAMEAIADMRSRVGLEVGLKVASVDELPGPSSVADFIQIDGRSMRCEALLLAAGGLALPVPLDRSNDATLDEWLAAAETIRAAGNRNVILCECAIRTLEYPDTTACIAAIPEIKARTHLPIMLSPGRRHRLVTWALCRAAIPAGADGIVVDVADTDYQGLYRDVDELRKVAEAAGPL